MELTIEQVDKQVLALENKYAAVLSAKAKPIDPATILKKMCAIVSVATPILLFVKQLLFFKKKWQTAIQRIIDIASMACGQL